MKQVAPALAAPCVSLPRIELVLCELHMFRMHACAIPWSDDGSEWSRRRQRMLHPWQTHPEQFRVLNRWFPRAAHDVYAELIAPSHFPEQAACHVGLSWMATAVCIQSALALANLPTVSEGERRCTLLQGIDAGITHFTAHWRRKASCFIETEGRQWRYALVTRLCAGADATLRCQAELTPTAPERLSSWEAERLGLRGPGVACRVHAVEHRLQGLAFQPMPT